MAQLDLDMFSGGAPIGRPPLVRLFDDEEVIDGFAGGGGASTGIERAIGRSPNIAINHDREALAMHKANHPDTVHLKTNITKVNWHRLGKGRRFAFAWFSPDCTFHSKARGGKPFRDKDRARRIRGLAWEAVRCAEALKGRIRMMFIENVEEWQQWGPLGADGRPDPAKKGQSFNRCIAHFKKHGATAIEWRELVGKDYGSPTTRKRLFVVIRFDGLPIVWPAPTHGPRRQSPYRTAAECIDFSLPVPSIFFTPDEARSWGRPLADATMRRIARGINKFVVNAADPFIIPLTHQGHDRAYSLDGPLPTITGAHRGELALVTPFLTEHANASNQRNFAADEPLRTICAGVKGGHFALVAPTLINTRNGERDGQLPRVLDIRQPFATITAQGSQGAVVAAFLAKHNGGHEATGQQLQFPADTITTRDQKALVTSHLLKLYGTSQDGVAVGEPMPTVTATGNHLAEVRAFLVKFYGNEKDGQPLRVPLGTVTTKDRFGLITVTIAGEQYVIADIGMRMLAPRELYRAQGFPESYNIDEGVDVETGEYIKFTKQAQTRLVGNSVCPDVAESLVRANLAVAARTAA
jgi:DNA (cytosine-5)-methyltransferase 1